MKRGDPAIASGRTCGIGSPAESDGSVAERRCSGQELNTTRHERRVCPGGAATATAAEARPRRPAASAATTAVAGSPAAPTVDPASELIAPVAAGPVGRVPASGGIPARGAAGAIVVTSHSREGWLTVGSGGCGSRDRGVAISTRAARATEPGGRATATTTAGDQQRCSTRRDSCRAAAASSP